VKGGHSLQVSEGIASRDVIKTTLCIRTKYCRCTEKAKKGSWYNYR